MVNKTALRFGNVRRPWMIAVAVGVISVLILYIIPSPIDPVPVYLNTSLPRLEGSLQVNDHLSHIQKLFEGKLIGPESFALGPNDSIYTGSADGKIWEIKGGNLKVLTRTGLDHEDCGSFKLEPKCGRPKGMKFDSHGNLFVVDSYKGLLKIDVSSGRTEILLDSFPSRVSLRCLSNESGFNGTRFLFLNAMDIASDGIIYISDSSTKWERRDYRYEVIETNCLGRILAFDPQSGKSWLVIDGLYLANGLSLSSDETYLLVSEMSVSRISKVYLQGAKKGVKETLIDNLPGYPDNIKRNERGNYYIGMASVRFLGASPLGSFLDNVAVYPTIKRFIAKITPVALFDIFLPKHALLLEISEEGDIVTSHHDPGAKVLMALSEAFQHKDKILIGHFKNNFIGSIDVSILHLSP